MPQNLTNEKSTLVQLMAVEQETITRVSAYQDVCR